MVKKRRVSGLSLIEVLIAMAIFVIGILAVLRVFPKSLGVITTNRDKADAGRMAQQRLEELLADEQRLPQAILGPGLPTDVNPASPSFGLPRVGAGADAARPYDFTTFGPPDLWTDANDPQALYRFLAAQRLVLGEKMLVPRSATNGPQAASTLFGPISLDPTPVVEVFREFRQVDPVDLRVTQAAGAYRDRPVFAFVDGGIDSFTRLAAPDRLLFELEASPRQLIVRYAYSDQGRAIWTQAPAPATALAGVGGTPVNAYQEIRLPQSTVIPGSVSVRQALSHGGGGRFSFDDSGAPLGVLRISPQLAGETVSIEYVVADWRVLQEKVSLTFDASGNIIETPGGVVSGGLLQMRTTDLDPTYSPLLVVSQTGGQVPVDTANYSPELARLGRVPLNLATGLGGLSNGAYEVTVYFRRAGNWALAPSIAPASYILAEDAANLAGGSVDAYPMQSTVVEGAVSPTGSGTFADLAFRPSEAGRNVLVSYWALSPQGRELVSGELHVVPAQSNAVGAPTALEPAGARRHVVRLNRPVPVGVAAGTDMRSVVVTVEGVSLNVRVVYDDQNYVRAGVPVVPGYSGPADSRQRLFELNAMVRRRP